MFKKSEESNARRPLVPSDRPFCLLMNISYLPIKYNLEVDLLEDKLITYFSLGLFFWVFF